MALLKKYQWLLISAILFSGGCATLPEYGQVITYDGIYLKDLCEKYNADLSWDSISEVILISGPGIDARGMVGSDVVFLGEEQIKLSEPIRTVNSAIIVPEDFRVRVFSRKRTMSVRRQVPAARTYRSFDSPKVRTVIVDAGHGGKDPGAIGRTGLYEKKVVLDIAQRVRKALEKRGVKVILSRKNDQFIPLGKRTEIASFSGGNIFISIHANSNPRRSIYGVEVYVLKSLGYFEKNEDQRKSNYRRMYKSLKMKSQDRDLQDIITDIYDSQKQGESQKLAEMISTRVASVAKTKDRGVKKSRFYVLRNTLIPAVLVEVGYLSNPKEERLLKTKGYRQKIANGIAQGILDYEKM